MTMYFFDTHGGLWVTCEADHPEAEAFGPSAGSRKADPAEAQLPIKDGETAAAAAQRQHRFSAARKKDQWDVLSMSTYNP